MQNIGCPDEKTERTKKNRINPSSCSFLVRENLLCRELAELPFRALRYSEFLREPVRTILLPQEPTMLSSGFVSLPSAS